MRAILTLSVTILFVAAGISAEETPDPASQSTIEARQASSLGGALKVAGTTPVHVLYIHGIGATGSGDSIVLQQSICRYARKLMGEECQGGPTRLGREYAEDGIFARDDSPGSNGLSQKVAGERYMGAPIWSSWDEWHASAPFVDHYRISFRSGKTLLVDELNWWPLVLPIKCKFMMPDETLLPGRLTGKDNDYLQVCSQQETGTQGVEVRSFDWIRAAGYTLAELNARPNRAVGVNRWAKVDIIDWRFSDALLGVGPLSRFITDGIGRLLVKCIPESTDRTTHFITVTHSLGSYLLFSTLATERPADLSAAEADTTQTKFNLLLQHLDAAFFIANQIPLLEMAWLGSSNTHFFAFDNWSKQRKAYLNAGPGEVVGRVVAWSDPNDLLTWRLATDFQQWQTPPDRGIKVEDQLVKNASRWFWLFENPASAHDNYAQNPKVIRALLQNQEP